VQKRRLSSSSNPPWRKFIKIEWDIPNIDGNLRQTFQDDNNHLEEEKQHKIIQQVVLNIGIIAIDPRSYANVGEATKNRKNRKK
jgi:hypothetical protein